MRILVAEDERNSREALEAILAHRGYSVWAAPDGRAACELLDRHPIELLITDLRMPGLDGDALIAYGLAQNPALRVLVISAYIQRSLESLEPAQKAGLRFLIKPFRAMDLLKLVREIEQEMADRALGIASASPIENRRE